MDNQLFSQEYPFQGKYLNLDGLKYHYLDEGAGEPVIMLHGNPSWSFYYRNLVKALRNDYRVIVPDHIGCGLSDKPADSQYRYTLSQRVADLGRLIDSLQLPEKVTLVVHDWGGMIGMAWAALNPGRLARLVVLNTAAFPLPEDKPLPLGLKICRNTQFGAFLIQGFNAFARGAAWVGCKRKRMAAELRELYCSPYDNWQHRVATLRFVQDIPLAEGDPGYDLVKKTEASLAGYANLPTSIFWGEKDFVFDLHFLKKWQVHMPHADIHSYADCGHYILEDARAEIIPLIEQFLKDNPVPEKAA